MEEWKDIKGYEGYYQVSNLGNVRSLGRYVNHSVKGKLSLKKQINIKQTITRGYKVLCLYKKGKCKMFRIHRLVAEAFIPNPENKPYINHINGVKTDNCVINLEYCTPKENTNHAFSLNLMNNNYIKKPILQYDIEGNFIKEWESQIEVAKKLKINNRNISSCCKEKRKTAGGYIWKYKETI